MRIIYGGPKVQNAVTKVEMPHFRKQDDKTYTSNISENGTFHAFLFWIGRTKGWKKKVDREHLEMSIMRVKDLNYQSDVGPVLNNQR